MTFAQAEEIITALQSIQTACAIGVGVAVWFFLVSVRRFFNRGW